MVYGITNTSLLKVLFLSIGMVVVYKGCHYLPSTGSRILNSIVSNTDVPTVNLITPTYSRLTQKADLTRLSQTLRLVPHIHWIVVEDSENKTKLVKEFLGQCKIANTHLFVKSMSSSEWYKLYHLVGTMPRGVQQRNAALDWLDKNADGRHVVYFADDDNTYDVRIFEEMRYTRQVSVWPVGLLGGSKFESPVVRNGKVRHTRKEFTPPFKVVSWIVGFDPNRKFALDMAAFAVNGEVLKATKPQFNLTCVYHLEPCFLAQLKIELEDLDPRADNCTKIPVRMFTPLTIICGCCPGRAQGFGNFTHIERRLRVLGGVRHDVAILCGFGISI